LLSKIAEYEPASWRDLPYDRREAHDAMLAMLDSVIQLGIAAPGEDATKLYLQFPAQSLILLSRTNEDVSATLMKIFQDPIVPPGAWLAAGNLMAQRGSAGFAAAVLGSMTVHVEISVVNKGASELGGGTGGSISGQIPEPKRGWPEAGEYSVFNCACAAPEDASVLAAGVDPALYIRKVTPLYSAPPFTGVMGCADFDTLREHYLNGLLAADPEEPPVKAHAHVTFVWEGPAAYLAELNALIEKQKATFAEAARTLERSGRMSWDDATKISPKLDIVIWDQRGDGSGVLPQLSAVPQNVKISGHN
jgi:hypothetical protein